jgi:hypothetical protein
VEKRVVVPISGVPDPYSFDPVVAMLANVCLVTINTGENSPLEYLLAAENLPLAGLYKSPSNRWSKMICGCYLAFVSDCQMRYRYGRFFKKFGIKT